MPKRKRVTKPHRSVHPQVKITHESTVAEVDELIAPLILEMWKAGFETFRSCQEHFVTGKIWVEFAEPAQLPAFLDVVATLRDEQADLWERVKAWTFGSWEAAAGPGRVPAPEAWEYHVTVTDVAFDDAAGKAVDEFANFAFSVSVLFPRKDLDEVLESLSEYNLATEEK